MKPTEQYQDLFRAILSLESEEDCRLFFDDLFTISELQAMAQRLEVAQRLDHSEVYSEISAKTGASSATVSRVARCLHHGGGGYRLVLDRLKGAGK